MFKVIFFTQNRWAYGNIHHSLTKELYKKGIYSNVMDWTLTYSLDEFDLLMKSYDVFVTHPEAVIGLHHSYKVPLNRIIAIGHGQWDLLHSMNSPFDFYPEIRNYAVISEILKKKSLQFGISREPVIARLGIHFDLFYNTPPEYLKRVGYSGEKEGKNYFGENIKRGNLVVEAVEGTGLELVEHAYYNHFCMPGYYSTVDSVIMSSVEEAGGLPMMEAAASGRLPIGTPVGYFETNGPKGGGIVVPINEKEFVKNTHYTLCMFRDNPILFRYFCEESQDFARENYDWSFVIDDWVSLLTH